MITVVYSLAIYIIINILIRLCYRYYDVSGNVCKPIFKANPLRELLLVCIPYISLIFIVVMAIIIIFFIAYNADRDLFLRVAQSENPNIRYIKYTWQD